MKPTSRQAGCFRSMRPLSPCPNCRELRIEAALDESKKGAVKDFQTTIAKVQTDLDDVEIKCEALCRRVKSLEAELAATEKNMNDEIVRILISQIGARIPKFNDGTDEMIVLFQELCVANGEIRRLKGEGILKIDFPEMLHFPSPVLSGVVPMGNNSYMKIARSKTGDLERIVPATISREKQKEILAQLLS